MIESILALASKGGGEAAGPTDPGTAVIALVIAVVIFLIALGLLAASMLGVTGRRRPKR